MPHARIPGSKLIIYPGIGHLPMEEQPDRSAHDVARFVDALPKDAAAAKIGSPVR